MTKLFLTLPTAKVEVYATTDIDEKIAIICAQDALSWLLNVPVLSSKEHQTYSLTCLLCCCQATDPDPCETASLLDIQEHLMAWHGLTRDDFAQALRVRYTDDDALFVWTLPPDRASLLHLPCLSYMRAIKHFAQAGELDLENGDLEIYLSPAVQLGSPFDTISGILKQDKQQWYPIMLCGKKEAEQFQPQKIIILTQETFGREEAASIAWRSHALFHTNDRPGRE